ncbi:MAG: hypothetical protein ACJ77N_09730 [Chloroflexota bacterium]
MRAEPDRPEEAEGSATERRPGSLLASVRDGASDYFYNSWRIVPLNIAWGIGLVAAAGAWISLGVLPALVVGVALTIPLAGMFRVATRIARGERVAISDAIDPVRDWGGLGRVLVVGLLFTAAAGILVTNLALGLGLGGVLGIAFATVATWGLAMVFAFGFAFWPLAVDPWRDGISWRRRARLAGYLVLAHPVRMLVLVVALGAFLAVSTVVIIALVTLSVGFVVLVDTRFVLPVADQLEERLVARAVIEPTITRPLDVP